MTTPGPAVRVSTTATIPSPTQATGRAAVSARAHLRDRPMVGYQRLAIRVIQQALRDLNSPSPGLRQSAQIFLGGHPLLALWCDLADIGPALVMARASRAPHWSDRGDQEAGLARPPYSATGMARLASARASVS